MSGHFSHRPAEPSSRAEDAPRCVLMLRAIAVLLAVVTLAFGAGGVTSSARHAESAVLRAAAHHHDAAVVAIASRQRAPDARRFDFAIALELPTLPAAWRVQPAVV